MIAGMTPFTFFHVLISLIGIFTGFIVVFGFIAAKRLDLWNTVFLITTALTSITGFFFPYTGFKPSYALGVLSLIALAVAIPALYSKQLAGGWRSAYVISSTIALFLNFFVLIFQLFEKVPALHALAPTMSEGPFKISVLCALVLFIILGIAGTKRFKTAVV
jgi:hypothetical protein